MNQKQPAVYTMSIVLATIAVVAGLTAAFWDYTQDDVFITYTYSRNIAQGNGFVFYPGERVQGSTAPLWALLMAGVSLLASDLLHAGNLLSALFLLGACWLAFDFTRKQLSIYARGAICLIVASSPLIYVSFGMETLLYTFILMLSFWLWARQRRALTMITAAALTWTRADGIVLGAAFGLLALWEAWQTRPAGHILPRLRSLPWRLGAIYMFGIAPWFTFAWLYFGTPLPNTFSAKQEIFNGLRFWSDGFGWWRSFYGNNWFTLLAIPLILLGLWRVWQHKDLRPIALWAALFALGYTLLNVTAFWYYTPFFVALTVIAAFGGEWSARQLARTRLSRYVVLGGAVFLVLFSTALAIIRALDYGKPPGRVATYRLAGQWINAHTEQDSTLLLGDLGIVGYYARRPTLDVPGLIVPDMYYKQEGYAVAKYRPEYVFATQYYTWLELIEQDWFHRYYEPLVQLSTHGDPFSPMIVYERRLPTSTPMQGYQGVDIALNCTVELEKGETVPVETRASLFSLSGDVLVESTQLFMAGQYPAPVAAGPEVLRDQHIVPLDVAPGEYLWQLECSGVQEGKIVVHSVAQAPLYTSVSGAEWAFAQLEGVAPLRGEETWSGGTFSIALHWRALASVEEDYNVFMHVLDQDGNIVAQADGIPRGGSRPTSGWEVDDTIIDVRHVMLPPDLPEGDYSLIVGWYDWHTGDRIPLVTDGDTYTLPGETHNRWPGGSGTP